MSCGAESGSARCFDKVIVGLPYAPNGATATAVNIGGMHNALARALMQSLGSTHGTTYLPQSR
jgi:hypothetical protein